jgi:hypothetical protein
LAPGHKSELEVLSENVFNDICLWSDQTVCDNIKAAGHKYLQKHGFSVKIVHDFLKHSETITLEQTYCSTPQRNSDDNCLCHQLFANTFVNKNPFPANKGCPDGYSLLTNQLCFKHHGEDHQYGQCHQKCGECLVEDVSDICAVGQPGTNCWDKCAKNKKVQDFWLAAEQKACHCSTYNRDFAHQCNQDMACTWVAGRQSCIPYDGKYECLFDCAGNGQESAATCECKCQAVIERENDPHNKICHTNVHDKLDLNSWLISEARPSLYYNGKAGFDIGYGQCPTYAAGKGNHYYCSMDKIKGSKGCYNNWCRPITWIGGAGNDEEKQYTQKQTTPATVWCEQCHNDDTYHYSALKKSKVTLFANYADYAYGGCKTPGAENYNPQALVDAPHTCVISGCMNEYASNYRSDATQPDPNIPCLFLGCMNQAADNYNQYATQPDPENSCIISGCTVVGLPHYNPLATKNNGKCCNEGYKYENEQCLECPAGTFAQQHSDQCSECVGNTHSNAGSSQCNLCKDGYTLWNGNCVTPCLETQVFNNEGKCAFCWNPAVYVARKGEIEADIQNSEDDLLQAKELLKETKTEAQNIKNMFIQQNEDAKDDVSNKFNIDIDNCEKYYRLGSENVESFGGEIKEFENEYKEQQVKVDEKESDVNEFRKSIQIEKDRVEKDEKSELQSLKVTLDLAQQNTNKASDELQGAFDAWEAKKEAAFEAMSNENSAEQELNNFTMRYGGKLQIAKEVLLRLPQQHFDDLSRVIQTLGHYIYILDQQYASATDKYEKLDIADERNTTKTYLTGNRTQKTSDETEQKAALDIVDTFDPRRIELTEKLEQISNTVGTLQNDITDASETYENKYDAVKQYETAESSAKEAYNLAQNKLIDAETNIKAREEQLDNMFGDLEGLVKRLREILEKTFLFAPDPKPTPKESNYIQYLILLRQLKDTMLQSIDETFNTCEATANKTREDNLSEKIYVIQMDNVMLNQKNSDQRTLTVSTINSLTFKLDDLNIQRNELTNDAMNKKEKSEQEGTVCGCQDLSASNYVPDVQIPDPNTKCVYACQVNNCNNWNCDEWCQCFREDENDVYVANGCTENSENTCNC